MCVIEKGAAAVKKRVEDDNYAKNLVKAIMRHMSWDFTPLFVLCDCVCIYTDIHICGCIRKILANGSDACGFICRLEKHLPTCRIHTNIQTPAHGQGHIHKMYLCMCASTFCFFSYCHLMSHNSRELRFISPRGCARHFFLYFTPLLGLPF